jgi:uncharacterized protein
MIRNTFSILNGIGERLEKKLWRNGILTWDDFIHTPDLNFINPNKKSIFDRHLSDARRELAYGNASYFSTTIKRREHWRLFDTFKELSACLDIETNGLMPGSGGYTTMVGIYNGFDYKCFLKDINLTYENLEREFSRYKYLITFYGSAFDVPFLKRSMPDLKFNMPHFDICHASRKLGFRKGLKSLETELGIERHEAVRGMNGYDAVKLWEFARKGSSESLDLLTIYNKEDTVNLFKIADIIYQKLRAKTGIEEYLNK